MNALTDSQRLRLIEEFTGHRRPPRSRRPSDPMKIPRRILALVLLALAVLLFAGCATVESRTTVTAPDGTVTVTESKTTAPDAGSVAALTTTAQAFAPRAVVVRQEKSGTPADLRRILHGRPITRQEIAHRWQPSTP